jgi:hypothetical protein
MEASAQKSGLDRKSKEKEEFQSRKRIQANGLCVNCLHIDTCTFPGCPDGGVTDCEEYACETGCSQSPTKTETVTGGREEKTKQPKGTQDLKGLCVNCEERDHCTLSKSPGGVWHCTEYR